MEILRFPLVYIFPGVASLQFGQHRFSAVSSTGGANFPEVGHHHVFEIRPGRAQFGVMEDGLASLQLRENASQGGVGNVNGSESGIIA